jgi:D-alanyl-D-alanine carboxypeptidase/D-alanyl-D-alanine-endopeptidase (penicillin-binding protein 4)
MFFATTLRTVLATNGITIDGQVRRERVRQADGTIPRDLQVVAVREQALLPDIVSRCNTDSQNLFAECLMKAVGAYAGSPDTPRVGSYATGRQALESFLKKIGVSSDNCVFDDGSGLSHTNRATPAAFTGVLMYMSRHPRQKEWIASMATPGTGDGTLRKRMKDLKGHVFAKTGHIDGVSTLSGYVFGPDKRCYAFSILCNDTKRAGKGGGAHGLQDAICRKLATWKGN